MPLTIRRPPGTKAVLTPMTDGVAFVTTRADPALVKALSGTNAAAETSD